MGFMGRVGGNEPSAIVSVGLSCVCVCVCGVMLGAWYVQLTIPKPFYRLFRVDFYEYIEKKKRKSIKLAHHVFVCRQNRMILQNEIPSTISGAFCVGRSVGRFGSHIAGKGIKNWVPAKE